MATELLEYHNVLLKSLFTEAIIEQQEPVAINQLVSDFDNVTYHISTPEAKSKILVSMYIKSWKDLVKYGAQDIIKREYKDLVTETEQGYDFSLLIDLDKLPNSLEERMKLVADLSLLRRNTMAAPFELAFKKFQAMNKEATQNGLDYYQPSAQDLEIMSIHYRDEESIFIQPNFDRVTVTFGTVFKDETDQVFGKVFLQEFVDARRRAIQNAPQVLYSKQPPLELRELIKKDAGNVGYVTFVLFPAHLTAQRQERCISHIQTFRDYFHYHIKCSKAYVHSRMRFRTDEFLKVLNRAKPENIERERKTASGRRFAAR
ncbi:Actin-related protein 2/3 complex subunit 2 [Wickerhamiella sorbophila]|uniref:Arp2/3 complex 34 kDa subunit n=1 Tax=Wickerhamiella sorbophila TaxID=45607 RepID=A0A2T0FEN6_9ASCO|nr:Actin-related protein 2/3 complex subunit 2 [Wickerhamiella sorbophila]PRT53427.1 Actin-related protein 2/3 complex subunit 2 [Wickerhamiella sorbophila]